jgi:hypothetical protein
VNIASAKSTKKRKEVEAEKEADDGIVDPKGLLKKKKHKKNSNKRLSR